MNRFAEGKASFPPNIKMSTFVLWYVLTMLVIGTVVKFAASPLLSVLAHRFGEDSDNFRTAGSGVSLLARYAAPLLLILLMKLKYRRLKAALAGMWGKAIPDLSRALWAALLLLSLALATLVFVFGANEFTGRQTAGSFMFSFVVAFPGVLMTMLLMHGVFQRRYLERPLKTNMKNMAYLWLIISLFSYAFLMLSVYGQSGSSADFAGAFFDKAFPMPLAQSVSNLNSLVKLLFSAYLYKSTRSLTPALIFSLLLWLFNGLLGFLPPELVLA